MNGCSIWHSTFRSAARPPRPTARELRARGSRLPRKVVRLDARRGESLVVECYLVIGQPEFFAALGGVVEFLGEVDELSPAFEAMRRAGFSVYAWQRIWQVNPQADYDKDPLGWKPVSSTDVG